MNDIHRTYHDESREESEKESHRESIVWEYVVISHSLCTDDSSWSTQDDTARIDILLIMYRRVFLEYTLECIDLSTDLQNVLSEVYWYSKCILQRGYTLGWKHARRFFYDHWYKGNRSTIQMCCVMRVQWDAYQQHIKTLIQQGIEPAQARSSALPIGLHRDSIIRYRLLVQLLQLCERIIEGDTMKWLFKKSVCSDDKFTLLMHQFHKHFDTHIICNENVWNTVSHTLSQYYCIVHTVEVSSTHIIISFNSDDSLM